MPQWHIDRMGRRTRSRGNGAFAHKLNEEKGGERPSSIQLPCAGHQERFRPRLDLHQPLRFREIAGLSFFLTLRRKSDRHLRRAYQAAIETVNQASEATTKATGTLIATSDENASAKANS